MSKRTPLKRLLFASIIPIMAIGIASCARVERPVQAPVVRNVQLAVRPVRVLIGEAPRGAALTAAAAKPVDVRAPDGRLLGTLAPTPARSAVTFSGRLVVIDGRNWGLPAVWLIPAQGDHITLGENTYYGSILLLAQGEVVRAVEYVSMEDYVAGVVSCELPKYFAPGGQEALAVCARTYALWSMTDRRAQPFDLYDSVRSQVYKGLSGTTPQGREAAAATRGTVVTYQWEFLGAFYSSTCGGYTAPYSQVHGAPDIEPFSGVECGYCIASKYFRWPEPVVITVADAQAKFVKSGTIRGGLIDIKVTKTLPGGWVDSAEVVSDTGTVVLSGPVLRTALGLRSTKITIKRAGDKFIIDGRGFGHGVGLCQFGADGMARAGYNYIEIIRRYYPGAKVLKIY